MTENSGEDWQPPQPDEIALEQASREDVEKLQAKSEHPQDDAEEQ